MPIRTRQQLKLRFQLGMKPTEADFVNLIDSFQHTQDTAGLSQYATTQDIQSATEERKIVSPRRLKEGIDFFVRLSKLAALRAEVSAKITKAINDLIGTAPSTLNTLSEIATALNNDANLASTLTKKIDSKANTTHTHDTLYYTKTALDAFFEGASNGKKIIHWDRIAGKPSTMPIADASITGAKIANSTIGENKLNFSTFVIKLNRSERPHATKKVKCLNIAYQFTHTVLSYDHPIAQFRLTVHTESTIAEFAIRIFQQNGHVYARTIHIFSQGKMYAHFSKTASLVGTKMNSVTNSNLKKITLYIKTTGNPINKNTQALNAQNGTLQYLIYSPDGSGTASDHQFTPSYEFFA